MKEELGATSLEEGKDISEVVKTEDKRNETERKSATKEEIDEVCYPFLNLDSMLLCLCLSVVWMPHSFH